IPTMIPTANAFIIFPEEEGGFHGQVGIGTLNPTEHLDVVGTIKMGGFKMQGGAAIGLVLTSDANGVGTWQPIPQEGIGGGGTEKYIPRFSSNNSIGNSIIYQSSANAIGIGTTSPDTRLSVIGNIRSSFDTNETEFIEMYHDGFRSCLDWYGDGYLIFRYSASNLIYISQSGNLGIGTSPNERLDVNGKLYMRDNIKLNSNWLSGDGDDEGIYIGCYGKVGIGTNIPTEKLEVNGKLRMQDNINLNLNWISGDGTNEGIYVNLFGQVGIGTNTPSDLLDINGRLHMGGNIKLNQNWLSGDGNNEGIYVDNNGFVGIGISTPDYRLTVNGSTKIDSNLKVLGHILPEGGIVTDSKITIKSNQNDVLIIAGSSKITIDPTGGITIESDDGIIIDSKSDISINSNSDIDISAFDISIHASRNIDIKAGNLLDLTSGAIMDLQGALIHLNGNFRNVARVDDQVICPFGGGIGNIITGSPTVFTGN
ncbi:MAG: hypothetical protein K8R58_11260, partial [Bacteroidales bacterium]|nr:hypothetical protein [Bacteroidales bacterium]